jgi:predicted DNA-binding protein (UPF0251 family)
LKVGIVTRNKESWGSIQLQKAFDFRKISYDCFPFPKIVAQLGSKSSFTLDNIDIMDEFDALLIRPIGRGSVHEIVFRMDMLTKMEKLGKVVINPSKAIERCADKYAILSIMENEKNLLREVLGECNWNKKETAAKLGISRSTLYEKLKKYNITRPTVH